MRASEFKTANKLLLGLSGLGYRSAQQQLTALMRSGRFKGLVAGSGGKTIDLLERLKGCVDLPGGRMRLAELVAALKPWSETSVKSALYWDVAKVKGYGVRTETADDGPQRYQRAIADLFSV